MSNDSTSVVVVMSYDDATRRVRGVRQNMPSRVGAPTMHIRAATTVLVLIVSWIGHPSPIGISWIIVLTSVVVGRSAVAHICICGAHVGITTCSHIVCRDDRISSTRLVDSSIAIIVEPVPACLLSFWGRLSHTGAAPSAPDAGFRPGSANPIGLRSIAPCVTGALLAIGARIGGRSAAQVRTCGGPYGARVVWREDGAIGADESLHRSILRIGVLKPHTILKDEDIGVAPLRCGRIVDVDIPLEWSGIARDRERRRDTVGEMVLHLPSRTSSDRRVVPTGSPLVS